MVIDTETHIMYFARNSRTNTHSSRVNHLTWHEHDADLLVQEMNVAGVDRAFLISYDAEDTRWSAEHLGFAMEDFAGGRKYTLQGVRQFPDRFYWFNTLKSPARYDVCSQVDRDLADGAVGFKLFPAYVGATLTDDAWLTVLKHIAQKRAHLLISLETLRPPESHSLAQYVEQIHAVASSVANLSLALLHAGCVDPLTEDGRLIAQLCAAHPNMYLSTAMPGAIWDDGVEYPFRRLLSRVERLCTTVGPERLMWATDWPWFGDCFVYKQGIDCFRNHASFLTPDLMRGFLGGNAERFVGRFASAEQPSQESLRMKGT